MCPRKNTRFEVVPIPAAFQRAAGSSQEKFATPRERTQHATRRTLAVVPAYFMPDQHAPESGIYRAIHNRKHHEDSDLVLCAGDLFPGCPSCEATFQLVRSAPHVFEDPDFLKAVAPRRIFQIAYDKSLLFTRELLLKQRGYDVISALGNAAAKQLLAKPARYHLFVVGHAESPHVRREMVLWLRKAFPGVKILTLNREHASAPEADYNVNLDGPAEWLQVLASAML
jgi:hypothetical protein